MSKSISAPLRLNKWPNARRFSKRIGERGKLRRQTDNNHLALPAKLEIRDNVLAAIGEANAVVFDGFAGEGMLYDHVWSKARRYVGCDLKWYRDDRELYVADSRKILRAIDLTQFNIFDFDPYGSPWEHVIILCARRPVAAGERLGITLTEGSRVDLQYGNFSAALGNLIGVRGTAKASGMARDKAYDQIIDRAVLATAKRLNCRIVHRWQANPTATTFVRYIGLVLEGTA
jgi:hypothetical protein